MRSPDEPMINGPALRAIREALDIPLKQLASDVGIDPSFLYRIERGQRGCRAALIRKLAAALNIAPAAIVRVDRHPLDAA